MPQSGSAKTAFELPVIEDHTWQMTYGERFALEGLLSQLKPSLSIETGIADGGSTRRVAAHSDEVHSFDIVPETADVVAEIPNAHAHIGDSHETLPRVLEQFAEQGRHVDFALVDGDHSYEGVQRDLRALVESPACRRTIIVCHDGANPDVRRGIADLDLLSHRKVGIFLPDFVPGYLVIEDHALSRQSWNGLALIALSAERAPMETWTDHEHENVTEMYDLARRYLAGETPAAPDPQPQPQSPAAPAPGVAATVGPAVVAVAAAGLGWLAGRRR